jgi:hypothetical protein
MKSVETLVDERKETNQVQVHIYLFVLKSSFQRDQTPPLQATNLEAKEKAEERVMITQ